MSKLEKTGYSMELGENQKERISFRNEMFHYGIYGGEHGAMHQGDIPWHWHDEFEFGYIAGGKILYKTKRREFVLQEGDGLFINSGVLHYLHPLEPMEQVKLQTQFFDRSFLAGATGSIFDIRYVAPVRESGLDAVPIRGEMPENRHFLELMREGIDLSLKGERFFELRLRRLFSELWERVYEWALEAEQEEGAGGAAEDERIKQMIRYVEAHFGEKLTVSEVAGVVHISERECYRLFQSCIGMTPMEFIISVRLQKAQELLRYTNRSVLEIALETGFGTSSYFGKIFRQYHQITPGAYRRFSGSQISDDS